MMAKDTVKAQMNVAVSPPLDSTGQSQDVSETQILRALPNDNPNGRGQRDTAPHRTRALSDTGDGNGQSTAGLKTQGQGDCPPALLKIVHYAQLFEAAQRMRLGAEQRVGAYKRDRGIVLDDTDLLRSLTALEHEASRCLKTSLREYPLGGWLMAVKGLGGGALAGKLLKRLGDLHRFPTVSSLWRYCGLDGNGWREKDENGKKHYSPRLLAVLVGPKGIADQFVCQRTPKYRTVYDERKEFEATKPACGKAKCVERETCTPGHMDARAKRYAVKAFLADLWEEAWR